MAGDRYNCGVTATLDPISTEGARAASPPDAADLSVPHHHHLPYHLEVHAPPSGGGFLASLAAYEVVAVTVNRTLDLDLLPSLSQGVRRFRWSHVIGALVGVSVLATMWGTIAAVAAGMTAAARRRR